jgi:4-hydroxy-tetrahydrodipicolinate synthase
MHGIAAPGLATEVSKLADAERRTVMDRVAEETGGQAPLALTIFGSSVVEQVAQVRHAESIGCRGLILAPDCIDYAVAAYMAFRTGDKESAQEIYRRMLPAAVSTMQGIENLICYGKRLSPCVEA